MANAVEPGGEIDGFSVGERIHAGGMGSIFRVTKPGIALPLMMKVPHEARGDGGEGILGFQTEAMIVPSLTGEHVPGFVAVGDLTRTPYLVTEWVAGQTLEQKLASGRLSPAEVAEIGAAIADALHSVHQQGVVHLDVKPANLILTPAKTAVLIDFGFASHTRFPDLLAEETRFGAGSAPYVSPEQLLGNRQDRRSDLFALGVVLYESATGALPFGDPDTDVRNRFWLDPAPPATLAEAVPPWLQEIILRCIEPRAENRYQSAAHVAFDLRNPDQVVLTERATKVKRAGFFSHIGRFRRAHNEHAARLRSPASLLSETPILLAAIDTSHVESERHPAILFALSQFLAQSAEFRLICLSVIQPAESSLDHLVRLRHWVEPLRLPNRRLTLHAIEGDSPADVIVDFSRHNNVDLIVLGAPSEGGRAWSQSIAARVTAQANCSVHILRVPARGTADR